MKIQILITKAMAVAVLIASQLGVAQTGGPYGGTAPTISSNGGKIQFEDFDLGQNADATVNPNGNGTYGYRDKSLGITTPTQLDKFTKNDTYRTGHDVDLANHVHASYPQFNGEIVLGGNEGTEFQYYTVNVTEAGTYYLRINYGHSSATPKRFRLEQYDTNLASTSKVILYDGTDRDGDDATALPKSGESTYLATNYAKPANGDPTPIDLTAGTFVLKFYHMDGGPSFNWFEFVTSPTLSMDDLSAEESLMVYPNPSANGLFNINVESNWKVYSLLGVKVTEGNGKTVDLSGRAKGAYILKTDNESKMLILK